MDDTAAVNQQREFVRVSVRIPKEFRSELLKFAAELRNRADESAQEDLVQVAKEIAEHEYGGMQSFFEAHGWRYFPGAERAVQNLVSKKYGSVAAFIENFEKKKDEAIVARLDQLG